MPMKSRILHFVNREGHNLAAQLDLPDERRPEAFALFAHCFTCSKNLKAVANITQSLAQGGIGVMRFDFTGLGQSEGDFSETSFTTNVSDLTDAARYLEDHYEPPQLLIGHSFGGAAVLQAAGSVEYARAVVVIGAPARTDHVLKHMPNAEKQIRESGEAEVLLDGRPFRIKKQFLDDLKAGAMSRTIKSLNRALLILHSPVDNIVGIENATEIFQSAMHPKSFVSLDTADHLMTDPADSRYAGSVIAAWAKRYIRSS